MSRKPIIIPLLLLGYLAVMAYIGYPAYKSGIFSAIHYFGCIGATLLVIVVLHFCLKYREKLRDRRNRD